MEDNTNTPPAPSTEIYTITEQEMYELIQYYDNLPWLVHSDHTVPNQVTISYPELKQFKVSVTAATHTEAARLLNESLPDLFRRLIIKGIPIPEPPKFICDAVDLNTRIFKDIKK